MDATELLKKVRYIEIKTRGLSREVFAGEYHSAFKGKGMAFSEVREYHYGDSIRNIDWNVTARFNHPFVKIYEEERELTVMLLIDVSGSRAFGTTIRFKQELITEIAAVLSFSAIQNNDKIGVLFFSDKVEKFIPPKKGKKHILRIIKDLLDFQPDNSGTSIAEALRYFTNAIKKRSIAFIISDFIDTGFEEACRIANNKHDVIAVKVFDPRETELPSIGLVKMKDAESGKYRWIDTSSRKTRNEWSEWWRKNNHKLQEILLKSGIDFINIRTDQDYIKPLLGLFKSR